MNLPTAIPDAPRTRTTGRGPATFLLGVLVAIVVLASAYVAVVPSTLARQDWLWGPSWPMTTTQLFRERPRENVQLLDEEVYLGMLDGVRAGKGFYRAQHDILNANPGRWNTFSPLTYRQPLLTYLWVALRSGALIGIAWGMLAGLSMIAAWLAAARFVRANLALVAPAALALVYSLMAVHPPRILYAEMWAGPVLVAAGALCALVLLDASSGAAQRGRLHGLNALGATSALLALLVRELAIVIVLTATLSLVVDAATRRRRLWLPWACAVLVWVAAYALQAVRVKAVSLGDPVSAPWPGGLRAMYFHPGLAFLSACLRWVSTVRALVPMVGALCALAVLGVPTLRGGGLRVLAAGLTAGVLALLVISGTPGTYADGSYTGYWGFLFLPLVLAWAPLGLRWLPRARVGLDV